MNHLLAVEKTTKTRGLINNSLRKIPDKQQDSYCVPVTPTVIAYTEDLIVSYRKKM